MRQLLVVLVWAALLAVLVGVWGFFNPDSALVERAQEWPWVGPYAQELRRRGPTPFAIPPEGAGEEVFEAASEPAVRRRPRPSPAAPPLAVEVPVVTEPEGVERVNLRPVIHPFTKELLRAERKTVGRLDSRFQGIDRTAAGEEPEFDPSYAAILGPFSGVLNDYVAQELDFKSDLPYEILTDRVRPWSYREFENAYVNVAEDLREAMARNPALKVFVGNGYYDLATPYFATEYTFDHLAFDPGYAERVTKAYYECGHMMYIRKADREKLKRDLAAFYQAAGG